LVERYSERLILLNLNPHAPGIDEATIKQLASACIRFGNRAMGGFLSADGGLAGGNYAGQDSFLSLAIA